MIMDHANTMVDEFFDGFATATRVTDKSGVSTQTGSKSPNTSTMIKPPNFNPQSFESSYSSKTNPEPGLKKARTMPTAQSFQTVSHGEFEITGSMDGADNDIRLIGEVKEDNEEL